MSISAKQEFGLYTHYWAAGTRYCEGVRGYDTEPILIVNVPLGLVEKRVSPEESETPRVTSKNAVYATVGM